MDVVFIIKRKSRSSCKINSIILIIILIFTILPIISIAQEIDQIDPIESTYHFSEPTISQVTIEGIIYDRIFMNNVPNDGNPGEPSLPTLSVKLLLPMGTTVSSIQTVTGNLKLVGYGYNIEFIGQPIKLSSPLKISNTVKSYPSQSPNSCIISDIETYYFRGYLILVFNLHPIKYDINSGELVYYESINVKVNLIKDKVNQLFRGELVDEIEVAKKVDNPSVVSTYRNVKNVATTSNKYDLLIITTNEFKDHFIPLKNVHDSEGISTEIVAIEDIFVFPNYLTPENIRNYIKQEYSEKGIEYVLIGGDHDVIPSKLLWVEAWSGGEQTIMPSDIYYACLDGTYNYDNDDLWGEPKDGENGKNVDLIAEVYVGRAPVGSIEEVDNFVNKTILQINSNYNSGTALFVGEYLWSNPDTWGCDYMDELIDQCKNHMYTTNGIPSDIYTIEKLYDRDHPEHNWPVTDLINMINKGVKMINHLGHSYYGYNMKMTNEDMLSLTNDEPFFIYSQGCMAGGFDDPDGYDCIGEYFTVKTDKAAFAVIMCARYGWGVVGSTDGANQRFHRQFVDAIFGENITQIGKANQDSKEDNINKISKSCMRWCYYEINLLGDPTLELYEKTNNQPTISQIQGVDRGKINTSYNFTIKLNDIDNDLLYYKFDSGNGYISNWLGPYNSNDIAIFSCSWSKIGNYEIRVKVRDEHRAETGWSEPKIVKIRINNFSGLLKIDIRIMNHILNL
jgi:hypothetical protein